LDNLKIDYGGLGSIDSHHARPTSLMMPRGSCGSDMALNSKGKRLIPTFNLSLTEGGIKPFNRAHRNNNNGSGGPISFGTGTQSFCYSPGALSPTGDPKQYRRSVQAFNYSPNTLADEFDFGNNRNRATAKGSTDSDSALPSTKQTNSELESYINDSFKDTSVNNNNNAHITSPSSNSLPIPGTNTGRRSFSGRIPGKILPESNNCSSPRSSINSIKEELISEGKSSDIKKSDESLKSECSEGGSVRSSSSKLNRISINAKKMFFLSFMSKKKTKEEEKTDVQQKDLLVSTMKKRYEKNSSKAQK